jgi:hypothetical protein
MDRRVNEMDQLERLVVEVLVAVADTFEVEEVVEPAKHQVEVDQIAEQPPVAETT